MRLMGEEENRSWSLEKCEGKNCVLLVCRERQLRGPSREIRKTAQSLLSASGVWSKQLAAHRVGSEQKKRQLLLAVSLAERGYELSIWL